MRNFFAILISVLYLVTNTELAEVFKVPQLIQHFRQHQAQNPAIGFGDFMVMHYAGDDGTTTDDDDEDLQLPFHSINKLCISNLYFFTGSFDFSLMPVKAELTKIYPLWIQNKTLPSHVILIFQPPRYS